MKYSVPSFTEARAAIPADLIHHSGKVFYSGRNAFSMPTQLYVLGMNPGGDPAAQADETIGSHTDWVANTAPADWSAYRDESWKNKQPGRHGMQPRILHMLKVLKLNPGAVPSSNLVFVRSRREGDIAENLTSLADSCWPFHKYVIESLRPKVILCLGKTAGSYVRSKTGAHQPLAFFTEKNNRRWQSHAYCSSNGLKVIVATHSSIADWTAEESDPTSLLMSAMRDA